MSEQEQPINRFSGSDGLKGMAVMGMVGLAIGLEDHFSNSEKHNSFDAFTDIGIHILQFSSMSLLGSLWGINSLREKTVARIRDVRIGLYLYKDDPSSIIK